MKARSKLFSTPKPNWKLPVGYLEKSKESQKKILKKVKGINYVA